MVLAYHSSKQLRVLQEGIGGSFCEIYVRKHDSNGMKRCVDARCEKYFKMREYIYIFYFFSFLNIKKYF